MHDRKPIHDRYIVTAPSENHISSFQQQTLGILGGGQLGCMLAQAAQQMGVQVRVYEPSVGAPAARVTPHITNSPWSDQEALDAFVSSCDTIGLEFENIPYATLRHVQETSGQRLFPNAAAVKIAQDRLAEKAFFDTLSPITGLASVPWLPIRCAADWDTVPQDMFPAVLKTARYGYDGKGQQTVHSHAAGRVVWQQMQYGDCVLEKKLELAGEYSVIIARSHDGSISPLPVQKNTHRNGILFYTEADHNGSISGGNFPAEKLLAAVSHIAETLDYIGVLCVEFFAVTDPASAQQVRFHINEMAPRPHNSGHHSLNSCNVSQFNLQARCLLSLPLPAIHTHSHAGMINLLGDMWYDSNGILREPDWNAVMQESGAHLHLYGKQNVQPGRKMGHINLCATSAQELTALRNRIMQRLHLPPLAP